MDKYMVLYVYNRIFAVKMQYLITIYLR